MNRRGFLLGLGAAITAPAIIRPGMLMPVKPMLSDGVGLISIEHPVSEYLDVMWRNSLGEWISGPFRPEGLRPAVPGDHIVGAALQSMPEWRIFKGDLLTWTWNAATTTG